MAQGTIKPRAKAPAAKVTHSKRQASKVAKSKTSKKAGSNDKALRKFTSGLTAKTESALGEKAGHLELIGTGRKKGQKMEHKGGSKKFG